VLNSDCCSVQAGSFASLAPASAARLLSLQVYDSMVKPAFIFDGRNILDHRVLFGLGFNVFPIGQMPMKHV